MSNSGSRLLGRDYENLAMSLIDAAYMVGIMLGPSFGGFCFDVGGIALPFLIFGSCGILLTVFTCIFCLKDRTNSEGTAVGRDRDSDSMSLITMVRVPGMVVSMVNDITRK